MGFCVLRAGGKVMLILKKHQKDGTIGRSTSKRLKFELGDVEVLIRSLPLWYPTKAEYDI